jgi:hypothetical protein
MVQFAHFNKEATKIPFNCIGTLSGGPLMGQSYSPNARRNLPKGKFYERYEERLNIS